MGEVERRQILPLPQEAPGSRETASKKTSGKCRCVGDKAKHKEQKRHNHKQKAGNHRQSQAGKTSKRNKEPRGQGTRAKAHQTNKEKGPKTSKQTKGSNTGQGKATHGA